MADSKAYTKYLEDAQIQFAEASKKPIKPTKKVTPIPDDEDDDEEFNDEVADKHIDKFWTAIRRASNMTAVGQRIKQAVKVYMSKLDKKTQKALAVNIQLDWESRSHEPQSQSEEEEFVLQAIKPYLK